MQINKQKGTQMKKKKKPFCGSKEFTSTGKARILEGLAGMNLVPITFHQKQYTCNKCGDKRWTHEDMYDGRHFCARR